MRLRRIWAVAALLPVCSLAFGQDVFTDSVTVHGQAVTEVAPDAVAWILVLERDAGARDRAQSALDAETVRVREFARANRIAGADVAITGMSVRNKDGRFIARRTVTLTQRSLVDAATLVGQLKALRPAELSYRLTVARRAEIERETQRLAVADARRQAADVAQAAGASLGRLVLVENAFGTIGAFGTRPHFASYPVTPIEHATPETFTEATISVRASVYATYALTAHVASAG